MPSECVADCDFPADWVSVPVFLELEDVAVLVGEHVLIVVGATDTWVASNLRGPARSQVRSSRAEVASRGDGHPAVVGVP